jgi:hypothetical protein
MALSDQYLKDVATEECYRFLVNELAAPFAEAGLHPLVLGGISLWGDIYPEAGRRVLFDLDIWVAPEEEKACEAILTELGFKHNQQFEACWSRGALEIDMHIHPINSERGVAFDKLFSFDALEVYERGEDLPICPGTVWRRPAGEDLWLQHALHAVKHEFERKNLIQDLHHLLQRHLPESELGKKLWAICTPALETLDCGAQLSPDPIPRMAHKIILPRSQRPFLAGLRLMASCGEDAPGFWWALAKGNAEVHRESGGVLKRYFRIFRRL